MSDTPKNPIPDNVAQLQALFAESGVGRVLVEYYTDPKPGEEWIIPDITELLGSKSVT